MQASTLQAFHKTGCSVDPCLLSCATSCSLKAEAECQVPSNWCQKGKPALCCGFQCCRAFAGVACLLSSSSSASCERYQLMPEVWLGPCRGLSWRSMIGGSLHTAI